MALDVEKFDVIVIGSGPGGEGAAMKASKAGKKVAVVEQNAEVGGAVPIERRSRARACGTRSSTWSRPADTEKPITRIS